MRNRGQLELLGESIGCGCEECSVAERSRFGDGGLVGHLERGWVLRGPRPRHSAPRWRFLCEISGWNEQTIEEGEHLVSPDVGSASLVWHSRRWDL